MIIIIICIEKIGNNIDAQKMKKLNYGTSILWTALWH